MTDLELELRGVLAARAEDIPAWVDPPSEMLRRVTRRRTASAVAAGAFAVASAIVIIAGLRFYASRAPLTPAGRGGAQFTAGLATKTGSGVTLTYPRDWTLQWGREWQGFDLRVFTLTNASAISSSDGERACGAVTPVDGSALLPGQAFVELEELTPEAARASAEAFPALPAGPYRASGLVFDVGDHPCFGRGGIVSFSSGGRDFRLFVTGPAVTAIPSGVSTGLDAVAGDPVMGQVAGVLASLRVAPGPEVGSGFRALGPDQGAGGPATPPGQPATGNKAGSGSGTVSSGDTSGQGDASPTTTPRSPRRHRHCGGRKNHAPNPPPSLQPAKFAKAGLPGLQGPHGVAPLPARAVPAPTEGSSNTITGG